MSVSSYEFNGQTFWTVYVNLRSKSSPWVRVQKRLRGFKSEAAALSEERRLLKELAELLAQKEGKGGITWDKVLELWELAMREEGNHYGYELTTVWDYVSKLRRWTEIWLKRPICELTRGDGYEVIRLLKDGGKSTGYQRNMKHAINAVFDWAIDTRLVRTIHESPVRHLSLGKKVDGVQDILTLSEIRKLLSEAKALPHDWYPIWAMALLTGMRNGELHELKWSDVDLENRKITVSRSYQTRGKYVKTTKSGHWRTVPISDELHLLLLELKIKSGIQGHVLPRIWQWTQGHQAEVLRTFCRLIGIRPVKFHALRACFATQLLAHDVAPARVMKICGWKDLKTMQHYIRLSGLEEAGATQVLKLLPSDAAVMAEVVNLFEFSGKRDETT